MNDEIDQKTAHSVAQICFALGVPTAGPGAGINVVSILEGMDRVMRDQGVQEIRQSLEVCLFEYRAALRLVATVWANQQALIIKKLESALSEQGDLKQRDVNQRDPNLGAS